MYNLAGGLYPSCNIQRGGGGGGGGLCPSCKIHGGGGDYVHVYKNEQGGGGGGGGLSGVNYVLHSSESPFFSYLKFQTSLFVWHLS